MRILVAAEKLPNRIGGYSARLFNLIKELHTQHEFSLVSYAYPIDLEHIELVRPYLKDLEVIPLETPVAQKHSRIYWIMNAWQHAFFDPRPLRGQLPKSNLFREAIQRRLAKGTIDLIEIHQAYIHPLVQVDRHPRLFHAHGVLNEDLLRSIPKNQKATRKFQTWLEWKKMVRLERSAIHHACYFVAVSEEDQAKLTRLEKKASQVVPNGVDTAYYSPQPDRGIRNILFVGSMNYPPNAEAVRWFCADIFPLITSKIKEVHFYIVGWDPPADIQALDQQENITVTGPVEDVRPHLADSAVVVVPLKSGSGTRLKILDAWSMAKAVVSTKLGAEGLKAESGGNLLLADDAEDFAAAVLEVLEDANLRLRLGHAGRQTVEEFYSWKQIAQQMNDAYVKTVQLARHV